MKDMEKMFNIFRSDSRSEVLASIEIYIRDYKEDKETIVGTYGYDIDEEGYVVDVLLEELESMKLDKEQIGDDYSDLIERDITTLLIDEGGIIIIEMMKNDTQWRKFMIEKGRKQLIG